MVVEATSTQVLLLSAPNLATSLSSLPQDVLFLSAVLLLRAAVLSPPGALYSRVPPPLMIMLVASVLDEQHVSQLQPKS